MTNLLLVCLFFAEPALTEPLRATSAWIDAGQVRTGPSLTRQFHLQNSCDSEIEILVAESGCGCAKPTMSQKLVKPGEDTILTMVVNTLTQPAGRQTWKTQVRYRTAKSEAIQTLEVQLTADLIREVSVHPPQLSISTSTKVTQLIKLTDIRPKPLKVLQVISSHPALQVRPLKSSPELPSEQSFELVVTEAYPIRQQTETVLILTDDPTCRELSVPVTVHKRAKTDYRISPEEITFRLAPGEVQSSRLVQIRHTGGQPIQIAKVSSEDENLNFKFSAEPGLVVTVRAQLQLREPSSTEQSCVMVVELESPHQETIRVPVRWTVVK